MSQPPKRESARSSRSESTNASSDARSERPGPQSRAHSRHCSSGARRLGADTLRGGCEPRMWPLPLARCRVWLRRMANGGPPPERPVQSTRPALESLGEGEPPPEVMPSASPSWPGSIPALRARWASASASVSEIPSCLVTAVRCRREARALLEEIPDLLRGHRRSRPSATVAVTPTPWAVAHAASRPTRRSRSSR